MKEILEDLEIPDILKSTLGIVADIVTVIMALWGFIQLFYTKYITTTSEITIDPVWKDGCIIVMSVLIVLMLARHRKRQNMFRDEEKLVSQKYYQFLHDYRNVTKELECAYKKAQLNETFLTQKTEHFLENAMNYLSEIFIGMSGQEVCGCIKVIVGNNGYNNISYRDACVKTFVRSQNTVSRRKSFDNKIENGVKISDNTDFMEIVADDRSNNNSVFYQRDLHKYDKELKRFGKRYKNSTENWDEFYIGTAVAPIRIANKRLFYVRDDTSYNILEFLCVDSLSDKVFKEKNRDTYEYVLKSFAATIYSVLSQYQYYLKKLQTTTSGNTATHNRNSAANGSNSSYNGGKKKKRNRNRKA